MIRTNNNEVFETSGSVYDLNNSCKKIETGEIGPGDIAHIEGPGIRYPLMRSTWVPSIKLEEGENNEQR